MYIYINMYISLSLYIYTQYNTPTTPQAGGRTVPHPHHTMGGGIMYIYIYMESTPMLLEAPSY